MKKIVIIVLCVLLVFCALYMFIKNRDVKKDDVGSDENLMLENQTLSDDITEEIYQKVKRTIDTWNEDDIYAISFFVYSNEAYKYKGFSNVSNFAISYNTEKDCNKAGEYSEKRWNYAFWRQNEHYIIDTEKPNALTNLLYDWYKQNGITNLGYEDENCYDENDNYIGKGPVGHYELVNLASDVAKRLQEEGYIKEHFGKEIPIIIHGLEYAWYDIEATQKANPNGEADVFIKAMKQLGMI